MTDHPDKKITAGEDAEHFLSRREFFIKMGTGSLAVAGTGAAVFAVQYLSPNVLYEPSPIVSAGRPEHFPPNSVTLDPRFGVYVVHGSNGFYAMSSICTHLGCMTAWKQDAGVIACPCHGSTFRRNGAVIEGPAPRPLPWLKIWLGSDGEIMVDRSTIIPSESEFVQA